MRSAVSAGFLACFALSSYAVELGVPGGGASEPVIIALASAFHQAQSVHRVTVPPNTGVAGALRAVRSGESALGRFSRPLSAEELREGLRCLPFASDAIVFVVGAAVKAEHLSETQLADIFSGRITDWHALVKAPDAMSAPIRVVTRQPEEALLQTIRQTLPAFRNLEFGAESKMVRTDGQALELLDRFDHAIGWGTLSNVNTTARTALRPVRLDGVAPNAENLQNGSYRLSTTACFLHKGRVRDAAARSFVSFVFSAAGSAVIHKAGLTPVARTASGVAPE